MKNNKDNIKEKANAKDNEKVNTKGKGKAKAKKNSGWDTTSKVIFASIALILVAVIVFVIARGKKDVIVDKFGQTHIVLTNFWGEFVQDEYGNLFEKVTDENGNDITKSYIFPDRVKNKKGNKIENAFIKLHIRDGWTDFSHNDFISIQHEGNCANKETHCQVEIRYDIMANSNHLYSKEKGLARGYTEKISKYYGNLKEYETEIFDLKARAMSYTVKTDNSDAVIYYYLVEQGLAAFEIRVHAEKSCFATEADIIKAIEKSYKLKDLGGERPAPPAEEVIEEDVFFEEETEPTSVPSTSAVSEPTAK